MAMALLDLNYGSGRSDQFETACVFSAPFLSKEYARYAGLSRCIIYCRYFVLQLVNVCAFVYLPTIACVAITYRHTC